MKLDLAKLIKERKNDITDSMKNAGWNQVNESISLEVESTLEREKKTHWQSSIGDQSINSKGTNPIPHNNEQKKKQIFFSFQWKRK